jgi:hypothetical protein
MRKVLCLFIILAACVFAVLARAGAQESTSDWIKRILDPATIDVKPYPESQLNRKITVDTIRHEDPDKRIAVYMTPLDKLKEAADYFEKSLPFTPQKGSDPRGFEFYRFVLQGDGTYPAKAKGLTIMVMRSPWVDGKAQIVMEYVAPKQ